MAPDKDDDKKEEDTDKELLNAANLASHIHNQAVADTIMEYLQWKAEEEKKEKEKKEGKK